MASKTRIANKTRWALLDILGLCMDIREQWSKSICLAEKRLDPELMLYLARMRDQLAAIERLSNEALDGRYQELP